jgi:hypothetical protein
MAQNGIDVQYGADGLLEENRVVDQTHAKSPLASGLLFFQPGHVSAVRNRVERCDFGIIAIDSTGPVIAGNTVLGSPGNGIDLDQETTGTTGAIVSHNTSRDSGQDGLFVSALSTGNRIRHNTLRGDKTFDAEDDSSGSGTAGTGNTWRRNECKTDNKGGRLCEDDDGDDDAD